MAVKGAWTPDKVRQRIQTSMLVKRVENHALGNEEMTKTQLAAALGLLRKTLPDLSSIEHSGQLNVRRADELTDAELAAIASGSSAGAVETEIGEPGSSEVH
jgi:hypothetical protein